MTRAKGWLHVLAAALTVGLLACSGSSFCPNCTTAIPVSSVGYPATLPELVQGTAFTLHPTPLGGLPTSYLLVSGTLPGNLALNPTTGVISGTPNQPGVFPVSIQASNPAGGTDQALTFRVRPPGAFTVTYPTGLTFPANTAIPAQASTLGNAIPGLATTYSLGTTTLPPGLNLGTDGTITGTPTTVGSDYTFTVTATNGALTAAFDVTYTISPAGSLTLNYLNVPAATTVGTAFGPLAPTLSNTTPGVSTTYAVSAGTLPPGLALNRTTGELSGTPTAAASYDITITATNGTRHADAALTILVVAAPTAASLIPSTTNPAYGATVALTPTFAGGTATIGTTGIGSSNVSAAATSGTAVTSGTVTATTTFTLTVTNLAGARVSATCTVTPKSVGGTGITPANPNVTALLTQTFTVTFTGGATGNATWTATGGSFAANSSVWTAPATPGPYTITATSVDDPTKSFSTIATVYAAPVATSLVASTTSPARGGTFTLTPTYSAGTGTINNGVTCPPSTTASAPQTANWTGARVYTLTVTNVPGQTSTAAATVTPQTVNVGAISPANPTRTVSTQTAFTTTVTGGALNTVTWSSTAGTWTGNTWTAPATAQTVTITARSVDDTTQTATTTVTVVGLATATLTATKGTITTGTATTLTPTFTGGTATIGTGGPGSSDLTASAVSGTPVSTGNLTSSKTYTLTVTNAGNTQTTATAAVTVVAAATASIVASTTNPDYGATNVTVTPTFTGATSAVVGTTQGGNDISTNPTSTTPIAVQAAGFTTARTYWLRATNAANDPVDASVAIIPKTVTVTAPVTSPDVGLTGGPGTYTFTASASGAASTAVTWNASGGTINSSTGVWTSPTGIGGYLITATSVSNPAVSNSATFTVSRPTSFTVTGGGQVCPGSPASMSIQGSVSYATSYQWYLGSTPVTGANGTTYAIANVTSGEVGTYTCHASNGAGETISSNSVTVSTYAPPTLTGPTPASQTVTQNGTPFDLTVSTSGHGPFTYQWYADGSPAGGPTSANTFTPPTDTLGTTTYSAVVFDACGQQGATIGGATVTVNTTGLAGPAIIQGPAGALAGTGTAGGTLATQSLATSLDTSTASTSGTFEVTAAGPGPLAYQWFRVPAGSGATGLQNPVGDGSATLTLDAGATRPANDGDRYFVLVSNASGQAVSADAPLAVGNGILLQASGQPKTAFAAAGASATFSVTVASADPGALQYQWYACAPGAAAFTAIPGATAATLAIPAVAATDSGTLYRCVVSSLDPGVFPATTRDAALFVDTPGTLGSLADGWQLNGDAVVSGAGLQLSAAAPDQAGSAFWPQPVSTARLTLAFTVTVDQPSPVPGDGFALVFADPSRGATAASLGASGSGLGARGIPGVVLAFDTLANAAQGVPGQAGYLPADLPVPFLGLGRAEAGRWGQPWQLGFFALPDFPGSRTDPAPALRFASSSHAWKVTVADGVLSVTLDGTPVLSGAAALPPAALVGFTAATSANWERVVLSDFAATLSAP